MRCTIMTEGFGDMVFDLYPELAPITVKNFVETVQSGFYDGLAWCRIVKGYVIQGGSPDGEYPDAFMGALGGSDNGIITYGNEGIYIPLNDLIDQYAPNFKKRVEEEYPDLMKMITCADGNIYGMPSVLYNPDIYNNTFINKKWLDAVGAEVPTDIFYFF